MTNKVAFNSLIGPTILRYVALKNALGRNFSVERDVLQQLDSFLTNACCDLTLDSFVRWCQVQNHITSGVRRKRMGIVRNLCLYRRRTEPACFVPDSTQFPLNHQAIQPHIFSEDEICRLVAVADKLVPARGTPLRREVFVLAIVLLYTTGVRRGELLNMTVGDYEPQEGTLHIRESKFHKSRILPLSSDCRRLLDEYLKVRRTGHFPVSAEVPLIWNCYSSRGKYSEGGFRQAICGILRTANIQTETGKIPRVHDFRHTFAVHALLRWYRGGADIQSKLPYLATYLGHVSIVSTQYYLHFVEEVSAAASDRFNRYCGSLVHQ